MATPLSLIGWSMASGSERGLGFWICETVAFCLVLAGIDLYYLNGVSARVAARPFIIGLIVSVVGFKWQQIWAMFGRLPRVKLVWPGEARELEQKQQTSDLAMRTAHNQVNTLTTELLSERRKVARCALQDYGRHHKQLRVIVQWFEYEDVEQANYIRSLLEQTAGWTGKTEAADKSTVQRHKSNRIEVASGSPENAKAVSGPLNYGLLVQEPVDDWHIITSADENIVVTIFPRSLMPPS